MAEKDQEIAQAHQRVSQCRNLEWKLANNVVSHIVNWLIGHMIITTPTSCIIQVLAVEEEMRELLKEMAAEKRNMETKLQKLSQAFQELHA